jgi:hypothetical protein
MGQRDKEGQKGVVWGCRSGEDRSARGVLGRPWRCGTMGLAEGSYERVGSGLRLSEPLGNCCGDMSGVRLATFASRRPAAAERRIACSCTSRDTTPARLADQFYRLAVSATHPPLRGSGAKSANLRWRPIRLRQPGHTMLRQARISRAQDVTCAGGSRNRTAASPPAAPNLAAGSPRRVSPPRQRVRRLLLRRRGAHLHERAIV